MSPSMNITYTCPSCGTTQIAVAAPGEVSAVPECSNPACTADPAWGAISLQMMKQAIGTVIDGHPTGTNAALAKFVIRLLGKVRQVPATTDADAASVWQDVLSKLAAR